ERSVLLLRFGLTGFIGQLVEPGVPRIEIALRQEFGRDLLRVLSHAQLQPCRGAPQSRQAGVVGGRHLAGLSGPGGLCRTQCLAEGGGIAALRSGLVAGPSSEPQRRGLVDGGCHSTASPRSSSISASFLRVSASF